MATPIDRLTDFRKQYMASTKDKFQQILEHKSRFMEGVNLRERCAPLLQLVTPWNMREAVHDVEHSGRHLHITHTLDERSSSWSSPTTLQALFDPDENESVPKVVVLQGAAGIGKTTTCQKLLLDWAFGKLYKDKFDFIFYLSCRLINNITGNLNMVDLLSRTCDLPCSDELVSLLKDCGSHGRFLFIIDGFDELRWTLEEKSEVVLQNLFQETHKDTLLQNLLRKQMLNESSVIVTTRPRVLEKLSTFDDNARYVEVLGFKEEDLKEYLQNIFETKEDAEKALCIIKANDFLLAVCTVPVLCRIICFALKPRIRMEVDFDRFKTTTSIYLLYVEDLIKPNADKQAVCTCLKKLCALANEGILKHQTLFLEDDLERRDLSLAEVESVFQNELLFDRDGDTQTFYSFFHLTMQELFAAMHYMIDDGSDDEDEASVPEIYQGLFFSAVYNHHLHLTFMLRFLFGLYNKGNVEALSKSTGCNFSLRSKWVMGEWLTEDNTFLYFTGTISCLYESQDEDLIRRTMSRSSSLKFSPEIHGLLGMSKNTFQQLCYCLRLCENIQSLAFSSIKMDPEGLEMLSSFLLRCQTLCLDYCDVTPESCGVLQSVLTQNPSLTKLDLPENPINDAGVKVLCQGLRDPACALQNLGLYRCDLTHGCCEDLSSVFSTNRSLTKLDLSINDIESIGTTHLCEGLRHPGCTLQDLNLYYCDLKASCCEDLRSVLFTNRTLTKLNLSANPLGSIGAKALCEALRDPGCTIQELNLCGCELDSSCCEDFYSVLVTNRSLTTLDLSANDLTNSGVKVICSGLTDPGRDQQAPRTDLETTLFVDVKTWDPEAPGWIEAPQQKGCRLSTCQPMSITYTRVR